MNNAGRKGLKGQRVRQEGFEGQSPRQEGSGGQRGRQEGYEGQRQELWSFSSFSREGLLLRAGDEDLNHQ